MAQLTIYLRDDLLREIERAAKDENRSVSSWVRARLEGSVVRGWPADYASVFGSLADTDFERPPLPPGVSDRRESME